jgi:hypothetical protein
LRDEILFEEAVRAVGGGLHSPPEDVRSIFELDLDGGQILDSCGLGNLLVCAIEFSYFQKSHIQPLGEAGLVPFLLGSHVIHWKTSFVGLSFLFLDQNPPPRPFSQDLSLRSFLLGGFQKDLLGWTVPKERYWIDPWRCLQCRCARSLHSGRPPCHY